MAVRKGRPEAAAAIWDWRSAPQPSKEISAGRLRLRGVIQAAMGATVGSALLLLVEARSLATVVFVVAALVLTSALLSPTRLYAAFDRGVQALGRGVGRALSWILLPTAFYLVFFPFRVLFRRGRKDRMKRFFDTGAETYWSSHRRIAASESYRRQF